MDRSTRLCCRGISRIPTPLRTLASLGADLRDGCACVYQLCSPHNLSPYFDDWHLGFWVKGKPTSKASHIGYEQAPSADTQRGSSHPSTSSSADRQARCSTSRYTYPRPTSSKPWTNSAKLGYLCGFFVSASLESKSLSPAKKEEKSLGILFRRKSQKCGWDRQKYLDND